MDAFELYSLIRLTIIAYAKYSITCAPFFNYTLSAGIASPTTVTSIDLIMFDLGS